MSEMILRSVKYQLLRKTEKGGEREIAHVFEALVDVDHFKVIRILVLFYKHIYLALYINNFLGDRYRNGEGTVKWRARFRL